MKLRIQNNSVRFRMTQTEVTRLREVGRVEVEVRFAPAVALGYSVISSEGIEAVEVKYTGHCVSVMLPSAEVQAWADSNRTTIESNGRVQVLVEKDFQCLHGADHRDPDAWPNPLACAAAALTGEQ